MPINTTNLTNHWGATSRHHYNRRTQLTHAVVTNSLPVAIANAEQSGQKKGGSFSRTGWSCAGASGEVKVLL